MSTAEQRVTELGLVIPDYADPPYGGRFGTVKAFHRVGSLVFLGGMTAESRDGVVLHPGHLGADVSVEQGCEAARRAATNVLGMLRLAVGSLDEVAGLVQLLCHVAATSDFDAHHLVGQAASDVFVDVFGPAGVATRATVGVPSLAGRNCVELVVTAEAASPAS
ncbi:RidA family protein [Nocardioides mangrovi]|uniref:RidA family protein n=1 Tax=Nocardioides mangrovi TaxID=2874580 RepID=A0ABS7UEU0_9ACTN|nr:RidA family protein [Nocardioides mangrovi]MBZ5739365.1 RidA family protein [Nocardioides mangrovi]